MEQKEALERLKIILGNMQDGYLLALANNAPKDTQHELNMESLEMAISALKKRQSYLRLINKYQQRQKNQSEELARLNSYRTPKKPTKVGNEEFLYISRCGTCGEILGWCQYCPSCGQRIDWGE